MPLSLLNKGTFILAFLLFAGCGEHEAYIADHADLEVFFEEQLVQVKFQLNSEFNLERESSVSFKMDEDRLSKIFLIKEEESKTSHLGAIFSAVAMDKNFWPLEEMKRMPNGARLPKSVPSGVLQRWNRDHEDLTVASLHQRDPYLIIGGAIQSMELDALPLGFMGTQYFKDEYGHIQASISVVGPSVDIDSVALKPGIYFMGNFGLNPFVLRRNQKQKLEAVGAMHILSEGEGWGWRWFWEFPRRWLRLQMQIQQLD